MGHIVSKRWGPTVRRLQPGPQADNTTPMMPMRSKTPLHGRRFVYGYSLDGLDFPCYLIWPWRTANNSFFLLESQSRRYVALDQAGFLKDKSSDMMNAGIHHTTMTEWIGADCPVDFLNVWFPAHWAPIVLRELHRREDAYRKAHNLWFDDPHVSVKVRF